jgi:phytoene desaturase
LSNVAVIGSGFAGLSAACFLAKEGHQVTVLEKNSSIGGRARVFSEDGFTFDMGPSWYWMPDVFERFFSHFGKKVSDYYQLVPLDPGFQIVFEANDVLSIPRSLKELYSVFEGIEAGSAEKLKTFLADAAYKYEVGIGRMVYKPGFSLLEFADSKVIGSLFKLQMFTPVSSVVRRAFKDSRLRALLEFPVLFLGAMADKIPALYTMMNYAALSLGTWYPMGGMGQIVNAMEQLALSLGVKIETNSEVQSITVKNNKTIGYVCNSTARPTDAIVATGDYHHMEQRLLPAVYRTYSEQYWNKKTFAPSCLIFYIGVRKPIERLIHHTLFFDADMETHSKDIYENEKWPDNPLFYVCCPSKTDASVAPEGMENLFILIPVAAGLLDSEDTRSRYFEQVIARMERHCGQTIMPEIVYKRSYCVNDFVNDYYAYKGNAYGLANTLRQTAVLKPSMRNKKVKNLFYGGQLTVPGPGVPPSIISGELAAQQIVKYFQHP